MALAEDFDAYLADFGVSAVYNGSTEMQVIFDKAYFAALGVEGGNPVALAEAAKIPSVAQGDTLLIAGITYRVSSIEPDGTGMVLLQLERT